MKHRVFKFVGLGIGSLIGVIVFAIAGATAYRAYCQQQNGNALKIQTRNGIDESMFVSIGGLNQWLQIRGEDQANPIILFLHGGPALSMIPFTYRTMRPWEKDFTIVHWDQRGAGRTYLLNGGADETARGMNQIIEDGIEVTDFLRSHLHADKIILVGESFGSTVGLEMTRRRPDLFYAYVGTGQTIDSVQAQVLTYGLLLDRVRLQQDEIAVKRLTIIGAPPYADAALRIEEQRILGDHPAKSEHVGMFAGMSGDYMVAPGYSLRDSYRMIAIATKHRSKLAQENLQYKAASFGRQFAVPLFFFQGTDDIQAPSNLVTDFLKEISAPQKELVLLSGGGHNAYYFLSARFLEELNVRVRPLAQRSQ